LFEEVHRKTGVKLDSDIFTIGFARRATGYKRADLILSDLDRLREIAKNAGKFQIVLPKSASARRRRKRIDPENLPCEKSAEKSGARGFSGQLQHGSRRKKLLPAWICGLNTPQFPLEASGTSGMKSALNGVPSLSILDGWWVEGHIEGVTAGRLARCPQRR